MYEDLYMEDERIKPSIILDELSNWKMIIFYYKISEYN